MDEIQPEAEFGEGVRPGKANMFSGKEIVHRGKSQKPFSLGRIRGENEADEATTKPS